MKKVMFVLLTSVALMSFSLSAQAQYNDDEPGNGSFRIGAGYVYDFPGLSGNGVFAGYSVPITAWLSGGIGVKHVQTSGYPRTQTVQEYTKANSLDFEMLFIPVHGESGSLKIGLNYTFSFYSIRRSYPVYTQAGDKSTLTSWPVQDSKGRVHGTGLVAEYEHYFGNTITGGVRVQLTKAYDGIVMGGPFVGIRF